MGVACITLTIPGSSGLTATAPSSEIVGQFVGERRPGYLGDLSPPNRSSLLVLPALEGGERVLGEVPVPVAGGDCEAWCSMAAFFRLLPRLERRRSRIADFTAVSAFC